MDMVSILDMLVFGGETWIITWGNYGLWLALLKLQLGKKHTNHSPYSSYRLRGELLVVEANKFLANPSIYDHAPIRVRILERSYKNST